MEVDGFQLTSPLAATRPDPIAEDIRKEARDNLLQ